MELYDLDKAFEKMLKDFPEAKRKLFKNSGEKLWDKVGQNIKDSTTEHSGNLLDGCSVRYGSNGGYAAVYADHQIAPHTHLIENGHKIVTGRDPGEYRRKYKGEVDTRQVVGWVPGKHMYRNALNELADELENDAEKIIDKLAGEFGG